MSLVSVPAAIQNYSVTAQTEQELAWEFLTQTTWGDEAYLTLAEASNRFLELMNKQLVILPMPSLRHQRIAKNFFRLLDLWLNQQQQGEALFAPHPIRLWPGQYREPDVMAWQALHRHRMSERASSLPDLVLEIISPSNEAHDTEIKFQEYAQAGIPEYWIVDPEAQRVTVYQLNGPVYQRLGEYQPGDQAASGVFAGFSIAVSELFSPQ